MRRSSLDEIDNLACPASPIHYRHDPAQTTKTSVHGMINMLGLAVKVARIFNTDGPRMHPNVGPQRRAALACSARLC